MVIRSVLVATSLVATSLVATSPGAASLGAASLGAASLGAAAFSAGPARADALLWRADTPAPEEGMAQVLALSEAIRIADIFALMRQEGIAHGTEMAGTLFAGQSGAGWGAIVGGIYDTAKMRAGFERRLAEELRGEAAALAAGTAFFGSDLGQRILVLEIEARRSLMGEPAKWVAELAYGQLAAHRSAQLDRYVASGDLVESNVMGALNANLAFLRGMTEAGPLAGAMTQDEMLAKVWAEEAQIRRETVAWLFPFLALAYQPLSDAELEDYIAFAQTTGGKQLNAALYIAFDAVFLEIYAELGRAAARQIQAQDI